MAAALRLLALVAMLMLPFAMTAAPAEAHHSPMAADMPMQHCPGDGSKDGLDGGLGDCAMPCAAALPAADLARAGLLRHAHEPAEPSIKRRLSGIELEIATPPPKLG